MPVETKADNPPPGVTPLITGSVSITAIFENRADGSWWVQTAIYAGYSFGPGYWPFRYIKPFDGSLPVATIAQLAFNEWNIVQNTLTQYFYGKTITVTLGQQTYAVGPFDPSNPVNFLNQYANAPGYMTFSAKVNASASAWTCVVSSAEFLEWTGAGQPIDQIIARKIVDNYLQSNGGILTAINGKTFSNITPFGNLQQIEVSTDAALNEKKPGE
jgi:hypothetical protein